MDRPTRMARATAILLPLAPDFIMKNMAVPRLATIATNAVMTKYFIDRIIS